MQLPIREYEAYGNPLKSLSSILEDLNKRFTVVYADTLFTPYWEALLSHHCPFCGCKIYSMRNKPLWYCRSNKHRTFIIRDSVIKELAYEITEQKKRQEMYLASTQVPR